MTIRNLDFIFKPRSVAVIGAGTDPQNVGHLILSNIRAGGFPGAVYPVNPHGGVIEGLASYRTIADLPAAPDLAIIATPPDTVAQVVADLGARGCRAGVVITAGFGEGGQVEGAARRAAVLNAARPHNFRIIGPNCFGVAAPHARLNASFSRTQPPAGALALIAQSGAVAAAMIDWAQARGVGFSHIVTLGDMIDVDFGDLLNYVAADPATQGVLLYIEGVTNPRKFMAAARAAAGTKPVFAVKSGRNAASARVTASHTGALAGSDAIYDTALARAGILRVDDLDNLYGVASLVAAGVAAAGDRLGVITNGGGLGALAADRLISRGGRLADLPLHELLQTLTLGGRTARVRIQGAIESGMVQVRDGRIVAAQYGTRIAEDAFYAMVALDEGRFEARFVDDGKANLGRSSEFLLLEALRRRDEGRA